ncbi:uncharacterized protein LY89DRAFT_676169 [Mollisia scopiformis]|uniref:Uncharacterized protein n=1 Tax=Mollisia scopiformis TaxID=149040 RepID=A0A132BAD3_MOLSC|nr:uncharacterized protein LY89DRAFT_676169 [Mollisia scopiformis]KUJ09372.1 hypothetical protein LY89DRAFT_676169 [Mollisia scopiformis]
MSSSMAQDFNESAISPRLDGLVSVAQSNNTNNQSAFPWERLPYELRGQIFKELNSERSGNNGSPYFKWQGSMPALIVALRTSQLSYSHVLEWFEKTNSFIVMDSSSSHDLGDLTTREVGLIKEVFVDIRYGFLFVVKALKHHL